MNSCVRKYHIKGEVHRKRKQSVVMIILSPSYKTCMIFHRTQNEVYLFIWQNMYMLFLSKWHKTETKGLSTWLVWRRTRTSDQGFRKHEIWHTTHTENYNSAFSLLDHDSPSPRSLYVAYITMQNRQRKSHGFTPMRVKDDVLDYSSTLHL